MKTKLIIITNSKYTAEELSSIGYYDSELDRAFQFDEVVEEIVSKREIKGLDLKAVKARHPGSTIVIEYRYVTVGDRVYGLEEMSNKDWFAVIEAIKNKPYGKRTVTFGVDNQVISQLAGTYEDFYTSGNLYLMGKEIEKKNFNIFDYLSTPQHPRVAVGGDISSIRNHTGYSCGNDDIARDLEIAAEYGKVKELIERDPIALAKELIGLRHLVERLKCDLEAEQEYHRDRHYDEMY